LPANATEIANNAAVMMIFINSGFGL